MKRLSIIIGVIMFLVPWLTVGCGGIPQQQFDAVSTELQSVKSALQEARATTEASQAKYQEAALNLDKSQVEVKAAQTKLDTAQARTADLNASLEKVRADLKDAQAKLDAAQKFKSDLTIAWNRFDRIVALEWLLVHYWSAAGKKDNALIVQDNAKMMGFVEPIGDQQLTAFWKQALEAYINKNQSLYMESLVALMDRNNMLLNNQAVQVRDKLRNGGQK